MSFDPDLLSLMASTFEHKPTASHDGYGKPVAGTITAAVPCHVTFATKIVRGNTEEAATSTAQLECPPTGWRVGPVTVPALGVDDHVVLADGIERRVLTVTRYTDDTGPYHQAVALT